MIPPAAHLAVGKTTNKPPKRKWEILRSAGGVLLSPIRLLSNSLAGMLKMFPNTKKKTFNATMATHETAFIPVHTLDAARIDEHSTREQLAMQKTVQTYNADNGAANKASSRTLPASPTASSAEITMGKPTSLHRVATAAAAAAAGVAAAVAVGATPALGRRMLMILALLPV